MPLKHALRAQRRSEMWPHRSNNFATLFKLGMSVERQAVNTLLNDLLNTLHDMYTISFCRILSCSNFFSVCVVIQLDNLGSQIILISSLLKFIIAR